MAVIPLPAPSADAVVPAPSHASANDGPTGPPGSSADTLRAAIATRPNRHARLRQEFTSRTGLGWHEPTPVRHPAVPLSVVVPARDTAHALPHTLDALARQRTSAAVEVIVVDDASGDATAELAQEHPVVDVLVRLNAHCGAGAARNAGTRLARYATVVYLDADMVLPDHVLADMSARARPELVLTGFRDNVPAPPGHPPGELLPAPTGTPRLEADHRVTWTPPPETVLPYSGTTVPAGFVGRPLHDTADFERLGNGRAYWDWDLPRMVVTALMAAPAAAVVHVGGFDAEFGRLGWGMEDTHLGAALIAAGLRVVPLRQAVGHHLDPPDAADQWQHKLASWPATLARYRELLDGPAPRGRTALFEAAADALLAQAQVTRR